MVGSIILALIVGAVIGLVARLVMPGKQDIGVVVTVLIGALGGLIGSAVASHFGYHNANGGVAWIPFFIGVAVAVVLIAIYESVRGRRTRTSLLGRRTRTSLLGRRTRTRLPW
ncbi:MAG TPA: GlsB/YeaQ/YmgE family stress response membrane protein [Mycobacterium sp.]|nr:GlsB/YeaQ/YmgE family stress response membrane protein [Mycobacterium sp.]